MAATHGGEMVAAMLAAEDVDTVFGIIDGTYVGLYSNLEKRGEPNHSASKHALHGYFESLRVELADSGASVTMVCPAFADTASRPGRWPGAKGRRGSGRRPDGV